MITATARPPLLPILLAAGIVGVLMGTSVPLVPLALKLDGYDQWLTGAMTAAWAAGVLLCGPQLPRLAARVGVVPVFVGGVLLIALGQVLLPNVAKLPWWFAINLMLGIGGCIPWILSETWINLAADPASRGRVMGYYAFAITGGLAIGPLIAAVAGPTTATAFYVCAGLAILVALPVLSAAKRSPRLRDSEAHASVWPIVRAAPDALLVALVAGWCESSVMNFLPIYAVHMQVDPGLAPLWLSVFVLGNMILMVPIGWLSDRRGVRTALLLCLIGSLLFAGMLPLAGADPVLWIPSVFLWGGALFAPYALGLVMLGDRFTGQQLAAANSAFVMTYTLGTLTGPPITGGLMDIIGAPGLPVATAAVGGAMLCAMLIRHDRSG